MPWFRITSVLFLGWAVLFAGFPHVTNALAALRYVPNKHADDWTRIVGLFCLGFAVLLDQAHRSRNDVARRVVARGVIACTVPCAVLMSSWQLAPDPRWTRFDIGNIALLAITAIVLFSASTKSDLQNSDGVVQKAREPADPTCRGPGRS